MSRKKNIVQDKGVVYIGSDHAGWPLRRGVIRFLERHGYTVVDCGPSERKMGDDYPERAAAVARAIVASGDPKVKGVVLCGSGVGVAIAANRFKGIRAVEGYSVEQVKLARQHNDVNVLTLGGRLDSSRMVERLLRAFLETDESPIERHRRRIVQLDSLPD